MKRLLVLCALLMLAGCGGGKSAAELSVETMKKCGGTVSVSITIGTLFRDGVTMHCDKMTFTPASGS